MSRTPAELGRGFGPDEDPDECACCDADCPPHLLVLCALCGQDVCDDCGVHIIDDEEEDECPGLKDSSL